MLSAWDVLFEPPAFELSSFGQFGVLGVYVRHSWRSMFGRRAPPPSPPTAVALPPDFGLCLLVLVFSWLLNYFLALQVVRARIKYKVRLEPPCHHVLDAPAGP